MLKFEIIVNIVESLMIIGFITLYFGMKDIGKKKYAAFIIAVAVDMGLTTYFNFHYVYEGFLSLTYIALYILYAHWFLKGDLYTKIFISAMTDCVVYGMSTLLGFVFHFFFEYKFGTFAQFSMERIVRIILCQIIYVVIYGLMLKFKVKNPPSKIMAITFIVISVVAQISFNSITTMFVDNASLSVPLIINCCTIILILTLMYYIIRKMNIDEKLKIENVVLKHNIAFESERNADTLNTYHKLCTLRHELVSHFNNITSYIEENPKKAIEYIERVSGRSFSVSSIFIETGNRCFDLLLSSKVSECHKEDINVSIKVMNNSLDMFNDEERTIVFSNLFDNAIRAARESDEKNISLEVSRKDGSTIISMINSEKEHCLGKNPELETTKDNKEEHGFGIKNIEKIIKTHDGITNISEENNKFCFSIMV